jgi:excisionase family DNA binding protein
MTAVEAAEFLGVTEQYVRRIRGKIGTLPGRQIKFSREAVIAWKMHCDEGKAQHGRPG